MMLGQLSCGYTIFLKLYILLIFRSRRLFSAIMIAALACYILDIVAIMDRVCVTKYHKTIMKTYVLVGS